MKRRPLGVILLIILLACNIFANIEYLISGTLFINNKVVAFIYIPLLFYCCIGLWRLKDWSRKLMIAIFTISIIWMAFWFSPLFKNTRIENRKRAKPTFLEKRAQDYEREPRCISKTDWMARASKTYDGMNNDTNSIIFFLIFSILPGLFIFYLTRVKVKEHFKDIQQLNNRRTAETIYIKNINKT